MRRPEWALRQHDVWHNAARIEVITAGITDAHLGWVNPIITSPASYRWPRFGFFHVLLDLPARFMTCVPHRRQVLSSIAMQYAFTRIQAC